MIREKGEAFLELRGGDPPRENCQLTSRNPLTVRSKQSFGSEYRILRREMNVRPRWVFGILLERVPGKKS